MKKYILLTKMMLILGFVKAQNIAKIEHQDGGRTYVYDKNMKLIASDYIGNKGDEFDYSDCIIASHQTNGRTYVYDEELKQISAGYIEVGEGNFKVVGCTVVYKQKNGGRTYVYDKYLKQISASY